MRWATADEAPDGLFPVMDLFADSYGTGRMSNLEFLPVLAHRVLNHLPNTPWATWTINVYRGCSHSCVYCFARPTHEYLGLNAGSDFDSKIVVKVNAVEVLRRELADPNWAHESVAMGTNTDPYQRAEAKYRLTRGIIGALIDADTPFTILTKSGLVTRDLDLIAPAAKRLDIGVSFSIPTIDEHAWRVSEPGTPHPLRRVEAMRTMVAAGIRTGALMAPILPGLSDRREQIEATVKAIRDTGAEVLHAHPVYLRGATREHFMSWLHEHDPALHARYERGLNEKGEVSDAYKTWVRDAVASASR
ncbi:MAG TPA: radical SAM protein [Jatrophihabitans sp.]